MSGPVLGSSSSVPYSDVGGEGGLDDDSVEVDNHRLWQGELLQLLHPRPHLGCPKAMGAHFLTDHLFIELFL